MKNHVDSMDSGIMTGNARQETKPAILVVEDDASAATLLEKLLAHCGYSTVGPVATGEEAVRMACDREPDLIIMDISLKGEMDGITAAEEIRKTCQAPLVYITGGAGEETFERAKKTMPQGYILKPFNIDVLRTTIDMALYRSIMERKLSESDRNWRFLLSSIPDVIFMMDSAGHLPWQEDAERMKTIWNDEAQEKLVPAMAEAFRTGQIQFFEYIKTTDGTKTYLEARVIASGPETVLVIVRDITQRREVEKERASYRENLEKQVEERTGALRESNDLLKQEIRLREEVEDELRVFSHTIDQSSGCVIITWSDGTVQYVNRTFLNLTGYSMSELAGIRICDDVNPVLAEPEAWEQITAAGNWKGELYNLAKNGDLYYLLTSVSSIRNEEGNITHYVIQGEDITRRKREEMELARGKEVLDKSRIDMSDMELEWREWKEKMMQRNISRTDKSLFRNINNSFTQGAGFGSLISLLEMLSSTTQQDEEGRCTVDPDVFRLVMDNLHIAQEAFKTFVNIDWIITNDFELQRVSFRDIYAFVRLVFSQVEKYCQVKKNRILINDLSYGYNDIFVNVNKDYLYKALYEGYINAMKFSRAKTSILTFVYLHNRSVVISIVNEPEPGENGILGIPIEYGKVIFEPFYRLSKLVFERYKTLDFGLGLTLIEKIVQRHGGEVMIRNIMDHSDLRREPQVKVDLSISIPVAE